MKAREKLLIAISVIACGISIAVFALVSLGHFIYTPSRAVVPVVGKMYQTTVEQVALLEPVPVPQPTNSSNPTGGPTATPPTPPPTDDTSEPASGKQNHVLKNKRNYKSNQGKQQDYDDLRKALAALFGIL